MLRAVLVPFLATVAAAQEPIADALRVAAFGSPRAHRDLLHLCDRIGGRLTGSAAHRAAVEWVVEQAEAAGLRVARAPLEVPATWRREKVVVRARASEARELAAVAGAWTPGLDEPVSGVLLVDAPADAELSGRVVLVDPVTTPLVARKDHPFAGAALVLIDGRRPYALVPTGVATFRPPLEASDVPAAYVSAPEAARLRRLVAAGIEVTIEASGGGVLGEGVTVDDVFVELPGVGDEGRKAEIVLVAVGLDSWDVGVGALADGAGVAVALEAARLLGELERRPQRTIRFAFLGGTAQGLGTAGYARRLDDAAVDRHVGGFVLEGGGGRLLGVALDGSEAHFEPALAWFEPVRDLGVTDIGYRGSLRGMPDALQELGVPVFAMVQESPELAWVIGTRADTPERVAEANLRQAACVLATGLWRLANAPAAPPRLAR